MKLGEHLGRITLAALLVVGAGCSEPSGSRPSGSQQPQPANREEAARLRALGYSTAPAQRPAWVDSPAPAAPRPAPAGWTSAGRRAWLLGPALAASPVATASAILKQPELFKGKRVRVTAAARRCGELVLLEDQGAKLLAKLPGALPDGFGAELTVEAEVQTGRAAAARKDEGCPEQQQAEVLLVARSALARVAGRR